MYRIGKVKALELMMTGDRLSANEAKELRPINYVVSLPQLLDKAIEIAQKIQTKALLALSKIIACSNQAEKRHQKDIHILMVNSLNLYTMNSKVGKWFSVKAPAAGLKNMPIL